MIDLLQNYEKCFYFLFKLIFLRKNGVSGKKLKLISPSLPQKKDKPHSISTIVQLPAYNFISVSYDIGHTETVD